MFFSDRILSISPTDKVLEVGPGATPFYRSDVFLEKVYESEKELIAQSGHVGLLQTNKPVLEYSGDLFPFSDGEFDYVICSHVLEHVNNVEVFISELQRVGKRGYLEFPTIYYDYIYNFPEHKNFLLYNHGTINWMKKEESGLNKYKSIQKLFYRTAELGHHEIIYTCRNYLFQGFEWFNTIQLEKATSIDQLVFETDAYTKVDDFHSTKIDLGKISWRAFLKYKTRKLFKF